MKTVKNMDVGTLLKNCEQLRAHGWEIRIMSGVINCRHPFKAPGYCDAVTAAFLDHHNITLAQLEEMSDVEQANWNIACALMGMDPHLIDPFLNTANYPGDPLAMAFLGALFDDPIAAMGKLREYYPKPELVAA